MSNAANHSPRHPGEGRDPVHVAELVTVQRGRQIGELKAHHGCRVTWVPAFIRSLAAAIDRRRDDGEIVAMSKATMIGLWP